MSEPSEELLVRLGWIAELVLTAHRVEPEQAQELLEELLAVFWFKHDRIADPEAWFVAALHAALERLPEPGETPEGMAGEPPDG